MSGQPEKQEKMENQKRGFHFAKELCYTFVLVTRL